MAVAAAVVGAALMIGGNIKSNLDQADVEKQNALGYASQADYARLVHARKLRLLARQQKEFRGQQKSMFAKGNISFSGSVIDTFIDTEREQRDELLAAQTEATQEVSAYEHQARVSRSRARALSNPLTLVLQGGGTALSAYANAQKAGGGDDGIKSTTTSNSTSMGTAWTNNGRSYNSMLGVNTKF